jgi:hypothetical protein
MEQYSDNLFSELIGSVEKQILYRQSVLKDILLWEELNRFSELGNFKRDFVETDLAIWLNYTTDDETNTRIEDQLKRIPFEKAYCHKNPEFHTKSRNDILLHVFRDSVEWRDNPALVRNLSIQEKMKIIKRFEYMCYYVINTREEMLFDIQDFLQRSDSDPMFEIKTV